MTTPALHETVQTIDGHGARVQDMFSAIAHGYDRANRWMSMGTDVRWRRRAVERLLPPDAGTTPKVLDLCAGTLDSSLEIHHAHPRADIIGGDFSAGMLEVGRSKLRGTAANRIVPLELDAHRLPCDDASLDAIFCAFGIRNLSDLPQATREQARCLRAGGRLTVLEFFRPEAVVTRTFHAVYNRTVLPAVGFLATGNLAAYLYLPRSIGRFQSLSQYLDLLAAHGFGDFETEQLTLGVACIVRATKLRALAEPAAS